MEKSQKTHSQYHTKEDKMDTKNILIENRTIDTCIGKSKKTGEWIEGYHIASEYNGGSGQVEIEIIIPFSNCFVRDFEKGPTLLWESLNTEILPGTARRYSGFRDKHGSKIFEGHILELLNQNGEIIKVVCEYGLAEREIFENTVHIMGFYFSVSGRKTFPIVNNDAGVHDLELMSIIGNKIDNPELLI